MPVLVDLALNTAIAPCNTAAAVHCSAVPAVAIMLCPVLYDGGLNPIITLLNK